MSYIRTTFSVPDTSHHYTAEEAEKLTQEEFDQLSLADQTSLYNDHRTLYDRLTGNADSTTTAETTPQAQETADESFRRRFTETVDRAISRAFGHTSD